MDKLKDKTVFPYLSVGVDEKQLFSQASQKSIIEEFDKYNHLEKDLKKMLRQLQRTSDPAYLPFVSMNDLYERVFPSKPPVIEDLLYPGVYLFVGAPKVGKSFLMAQLAYHVSMGFPLWGYTVHQGAVLYLALEDDYCRLQERLYRMFGEESTESLYLAVNAHTLDSGLEMQLKCFIREHPDTRLIIVDTLQKIRKAGPEKYNYASDYEVMTGLKQLADETEICLLLVHHTRKQQSDDQFDKISGTNGLMGAADGAFLLQKEKRTANVAILDISGRDLQDQRLFLKRDAERLVWELERREIELYKEPPDLILEAVANLLTEEQPEWKGTATELVAALGMNIQPNALTKRLNVRAGKLFLDFHIRYENTHIRTGSCIRLTRVEDA